MSYKSIADYGKKIAETLSKVDNYFIKLLTQEILNRIDGKSEIFLIGNGGSAANAHHISGDYSKTFAMLGKPLKITSLSDNGCYITAAANDIDFSEIYEMLINTRINQNDLLIILSGSRNSMNLIKAARKASASKIKSAALLGYTGGALKKIVDIPIHCYIEDMEIAEDCQIIIFHYIKQKIVDILATNSGCNSQKYNKRTNQNLIA